MAIVAKHQSEIVIYFDNLEKNKLSLQIEM